MDSLTQIALGSSVAAACVPATHRRKAAIAGALLGTLPDLDMLLDYGNPVANFTMHRGFSHSLPMLTATALVIWAVLRLFWMPVTMLPLRWLAAILMALLTHPLLDAHTAYGTQLFWPFGGFPVFWSTLFIIDPIYTLPLLAGMLAVIIRPTSRTASRCLIAGLTASMIYLGWSWAAQSLVAGNARQTLEAKGIHDAKIFITPTPFNTLLWRIVVLSDGGHLEGYDSLVADDGPIHFVFHASDDAALAAAATIPAVARLRWFSNGFVQAFVKNGILHLADIRMGGHPDYVFRHAVAHRSNPGWQEIPPRRMPISLRPDFLAFVWDRIWTDRSD
jgi:inner membrane protein